MILLLDDLGILKNCFHHDIIYFIHILYINKYLFIGMREDALKIANQALQYLPNDASIYFNIANILGKVGNFVEAEIYFKNAISRNPKDAMFYTNLGVLYHRWNKFDEAENMYKRALEIKPKLNSANENLRKLYSLKSSIK